jgi:hypothetical protein
MKFSFVDISHDFWVKLLKFYDSFCVKMLRGHWIRGRSNKHLIHIGLREETDSFLFYLFFLFFLGMLN